MDIPLLHSGHRHVSTTHMAVFRVVRKKNTKLQVFANFWPQKNFTTLYHPHRTLQVYLRHIIFCSPKLKMKLKGLKFCGSCWDSSSRNLWIKESPKRGIFGSVSENVRPRKSLYIYIYIYIYIYMPYIYICQFCIKKGIFLPHESSFFKGICPKTFGPHCV